MRSAVGLLVLLLAEPLLAQGARQAQPTPSPGAPVLIDVVATDGRGRSVENLKPADFEVREDGSSRLLEEVRFVKIAQSAAGSPEPSQIDVDERTQAARPNARLFAIFLDEYHVSAGNGAQVRDALRRFVSEGLERSDLVVVMRPLDSLLAIRMTRDREEIYRAVEAFDGRKGDYAPRNAAERSFIVGNSARVEQLRTQVTTSALNALAAYLGSLGNVGRKTLLVVSEGLPGIDLRRGFEALPTIDSVIRAANRSNVAVYGIDPRPVGPIEETSVDAVNVLERCATATGGRMMVHGDLQGGMTPIASDSRGYYLLAYRSDRKADGAFHDVKVSVKRPGVTLRVRSGYWAPTPDEGLVASLSTPRRAPPEPPRHISPFIRAWFGTSRGADGKMRVTFVWEPAPAVPGERIKKPTASRVQFRAIGPDGTALFEGPVLPSGPLRPDPLNEPKARAVFDAPPGSLRLRMSIESAAAESIDSDVRELTVRELTGAVALGTASFLRARTARDFRALLDDPDAAPAASREFSRTERLIIRVPVYTTSGEPVDVMARLLSRGGHAMRDLTVQPPTTPGGQNQIDLPLAGLAAGDYFVEISATARAGQVKDLLAFRVTS